jgi:hypothetical protein
MSIVVFALEKTVDGPVARHFEFGESELNKAIAKAAELCSMPQYSHVTSKGEMASCVGKPGVDSVVNGKTPDGEDYDWSKAGRAGKMRSNDYTKVLQKVV